MDNDTKSLEPEISDHREIQKSIQLLDRTTFWLWWNGIAVVILVLATMAALYVPRTDADGSPVLQPERTFLVVAMFLLLLGSNGYALFQLHQFKVFRHRLADQMQVTIQQRMRADKFYGLAIIDPLTGLYNRRFGEESLQKEIVRAEKNNLDLAVIAIDLDYFKEINDQYGHAAGDLVLKEFSRLVRRAIRACDVPVRIGGDEFLIVLPECSRENVHIILSRLKRFEIMVNRQKIMVCYSRGHAQYQVGDTPQSIVQRADKVLYAEKAGRSTSSRRPDSSQQVEVR